MSPLLKLYNRLKTLVTPTKSYPVIYNVNSGNESDYQKHALLVSIAKPFLLSDDAPELFNHQNLRRGKQIAALLGEFGYLVDTVDRRGLSRLTKRNYDLIINDRADVKSVDASFRDATVKIFLATAQNYIMHNGNLRRRHRLLRERRRCRMEPRRLFPEVMPYLAKADVTIGVGNTRTMSTWRNIFRGPIYPFNTYGFKETEFVFDTKDFATAQKNFLFFASRSQVLKGLDLLLEIFPKHPDLHLHVCSDFHKERDFCACYHKELYETPNVHPLGWIRVNSPEFYGLVQRCGYVILPTCSEGQSGSVVQCMYAGSVPLVTKEAGIDTEDFGVTFCDDSLAEIERTIIEISALPESWLREHSVRTRQVAEQKYSEDAFMRRWRDVLAEILNGAGAKVEKSTSPLRA
jgi:glycosyltransferase involved in cell wall biosynthesis